MDVPFWDGLFWIGGSAKGRSKDKGERRKEKGQRKRIHRGDAKGAEKGLKKILATDPHGR